MYRIGEEVCHLKELGSGNMGWETLGSSEIQTLLEGTNWSFAAQYLKCQAGWIQEKMKHQVGFLDSVLVDDREEIGPADHKSWP